VYNAEYQHAQGYSTYQIMRAFLIQSIISNIILLGVLFVCYRVGRNLDLKIHIRAVLLILFGGAYLGSSLGLLIASFTIIPPESLETAIFGFLSSSHLSIAFIVFTTVSLAYIRTFQMSIAQVSPIGTPEEELKMDPTRPQVLWLILVIFCISLVTGTLHAWRMYLTPSLIEQNTSITAIERYLLVTSFLVEWINLAMLLLGSYWVGRYLDLKMHLGASIFFVIICTWLGYSLGGTIIIFRVLSVSLPSALQLGVLSSIGAVFSPFFQIFTALSVAYLISTPRISVPVSSVDNMKEAH